MCVAITKFAWETLLADYGQTTHRESGFVPLVPLKASDALARFRACDKACFRWSATEI